MIWDIAAGIIIGGGALVLIATGINVVGTFYEKGYDQMTAVGWMMVIAGAGIAAFTLFKAFYQ